MKTYITMAAAAAIVLTGANATVAQAQSKDKKAAAATTAPARLGGKPNLNGIWQAMNSAFWDLEPHSAGPAPEARRQIGARGAVPAGEGVVDGNGYIPYSNDALKVRDENREAQSSKDPEAGCYLPGIPRATYMNHPFQIIQAADGDMLMAYAYHSANRAVYMKPVEVPPIDTWMGTSYGAWEGDTLKVVTLGQNGMTWLDRAGNFLSPTASVTERFKLIDPTHIAYEATIDDPETYTKPWKISMTLYKNVEPNARLLEFNCVPFAEELLYGDLLADKNKYPRK